MKKCIEQGCYHPSRSRDRCQKHYDKYKKSVEYTPARVKSECKADGCVEQTYRKSGYCSVHNERFRKGFPVNGYKAECVVCGTAFIANQKKQVICPGNSSCKKQYDILKAKKYAENHRDRINELQRIRYYKDVAKSRRKHRDYKNSRKEESAAIGRRYRNKKKNNTIGYVSEPYTKKEIGDRDNWICHLCGEIIEEGKYPPRHARASTIEHIIPISKGGVDTKYNVKIAHYGCNASKNNNDALRSGYQLPPKEIDRLDE
jgi:5-methylcytosine-specific restriction endonuclease McrA